MGAGTRPGNSGNLAVLSVQINLVGPYLGYGIVIIVLITRRSLVQIRPPLPKKFKALQKISVKPFLFSYLIPTLSHIPLWVCGQAAAYSCHTKCLLRSYKVL